MARLSRFLPPRFLPQEPAFSPLMLSDRLLTLAQDADRAGYRLTAEHLLLLAEAVLEESHPTVAARGRGRDR